MKQVRIAAPDAAHIFNGILAIIRTTSKSLIAISLIAYNNFLSEKLKCSELVMAKNLIPFLLKRIIHFDLFCSL